MALAALLALPARVGANGRFPLAQHVVVGTVGTDRVIVLRATFGVVVSTDSGATFHWSCEEALGYSGQWDPPVALTSDGTVHVGLPDGLVQTRDGCSYVRNATAPMTVVQDLANDAAGQAVLGVEAALGQPNHVFASSDRGGTFRVLGAGVTGALLETVDAAPSRPARVYATAVDATSNAPRLYRSDDGGATLALATTDFLGGTDAFLSAIDPADPARLWVRASHGAGTLLLRSVDSGASFTRAYETASPMLGFALSDDGARVWVGARDEGLFRSDDGGATFHHVADLHVTCLRYYRDSLYVCSNHLLDGFALSRWRDGAAAPEALLYLDQIDGPFDCVPGMAEHDVCAPRWPALALMLAQRDAGAPDAARDAGPLADVLAPDGGGDAATSADASPPRDAPLDSAAPDAGPTRRGSACGCRVAGAARGASFTAAALAALAAALVRRTRRPTSRAGRARPAPR